MSVPVEAGRRASSVRPTPLGVGLVVLLVACALLAPEVLDPQMAGFVWAAGLGILVVGVVWPFVVLAAVTVSAEDPGMFVATQRAGPPVRRGEITEVPVRIGRRLGEVTLRVGDRDSSVTVPVGTETVLDVAFVARRRGRFDRVPVRLRCDAPFGVVRVSRVVDVVPPRPLVVGPARVAVGDVDVPHAAGQGEVPIAAIGHGGDTVRSVRPYVSGDPAHLVHWPTTARTGSLVVRELEPPSARAVAVVVDLGSVAPESNATGATDPSVPPPEAAEPAEAVVARAGATIEALLDRGVRVVVCSADPAPRVGDVADRDALFARLALATGGPTGSAPPGWPVLRFASGSGGTDRA